MLSRTVDDSSAFSSIVGLLLVMTAQRRRSGEGLVARCRESGISTRYGDEEALAAATPGREARGGSGKRKRGARLLAGERMELGLNLGGFLVDRESGG